MASRALSFLARAFAAQDSSFDPAFYSQAYPDLRCLGTPGDLLRHYNRHGRNEGRFPSLSAAREHFERLYGAPPADFDLAIYRQLNSDLAKHFSEPVQFELHFLEYGRFEDRPYAAPPSAQEPSDAWHALLNLYEFNLLNEGWLSRPVSTREEALSHFEREGIARLAPLAREWRFDPPFYRGAYAAAGDDVSLYRKWLSVGLREGKAPNESRALVPFLGGNIFPSCFDWRRFCEAKQITSTPAQRARVTAIERLFESPLDDVACACIAQAGSAQLYEAIGDYNLIRARFSPAANAYRRACASSPATSTMFLRFGDALNAKGDGSGALHAFRRALAFPDCSIWALVHAVKMILGMKMFPQAMQLVEAEHRRFGANALFRGIVDEVAAASFASVAEAMHASLRVDTDVKVIDEYADKHLAEITQFIRRTKVPEQRLRLTGKPDARRVIILACLDLPQCRFYRVEQKRRLLEAQKIEVEVFDFNNPDPFITALPGASCAIFYRVPAYPKVVEAILVADALGIETFYDIDDLVFTRAFPDEFETYEGQISRDEYFGLAHGVALYRHAMALCDGAIASTPPLAAAMADIVRGGSGNTWVVPNGLDERSGRAVRYGLARPCEGQWVTIFYGTGTKAHGRDFTNLVAPALLDVLAAFEHCRLVVVGYIVLDARFDPFLSRISRFDFIGELDSYWALLASCDINIAVLHRNALADCKSEIKWLEAAIVGVPSIVSATATYEAIIVDGVDGLIARERHDWCRHLRTLVGDADLRRSIGARARIAALERYGASSIGATLSDALFSKKTLVAETPRKRRVLICNVFFSPQSIGGATRVVEDNVDQLIDRYGSEFEIAICSTWNGAVPGTLRVHSFRGCPVYCLGTRSETNMDWRPFDLDVRDGFDRILQASQPDLIHFHCVQRLTATVVEMALDADIPYIVTVHDAWWISDHQFLVDQHNLLALKNTPFVGTLPVGVSRAESIERSQRLRSLLNAGVRTLAVSTSFAKIYQRAGIANVQVCANGLAELPTFISKRTPAGQLVLGHIGGRSAHKGAILVEIVLKSHHFCNLSLVMIDGTLDEGTERRETWGGTSVLLRAPVKKDQVAELFAEIDVLLAPSIWPESYGLVAREALFYRTWVVASDRGAMADDLIDGVNGFRVDPEQCQDIARVLSDMNANAARFKVAPAKAKLRPSNAQVDDLVDVYREILDSRPRALAARAHPLTEES